MESSRMSNPSIREEDQYQHSTLSRPLISYDQFNVAFGGAEWDIPNLDTTTWSSSGHTLSPTSTLYSPKNIESGNPFDLSFQETHLGTSPSISFVKNEIFSDSPLAYPMTESLGLSDPTETENWKDIPPVPFPEQQRSTSNIPSPTTAPNTSRILQPTPQPKPQSRPIRTRSSKKSCIPTPPPPKRKATSQTTKSSKSRSSPSPSICENTIGRMNHNLIEKKYRNRLNRQFDTLLSILPASKALNDEAEESSAKRISKAEVLILAKERIKTLERENREIYEERGRLKKSLDELQMACDCDGQ